MIAIFFDVVLPVFGVSALAYLVGRWKAISPSAVSQLTLYLFTPALTFSALTARRIDLGESAQIVAFVVILALLTMALGYAIAFGLRLSPGATGALQLSTVFMNSGNFGLSVSLLAFGEEGLQRAVVFFVTQTVLSGTLAVFLVSRGNGTRQALLAMLKIPTAYAAIAAVLVVTTGVEVPALIGRTAGILGAAAVPAMLVVLGLQLAHVRLGDDLPGVFGATFVRLVVSVGLAFGLAAAMGLRGLNHDVAILQASMPTAVFTVIVATEYNARPRFVTSVVLTTTLGSLITLTVLLSLLAPNF